MNEKIEVPTMQVPPIKKICMTIGQLPTSYLETMSYYEMLIWFVNYLRDDIIPVVNANGQAVEELQELYVELQNYVNHYFDEEFPKLVDESLQKMVDDGTLEDILKNYIDLHVERTYNTVADLVDADLVENTICNTLGYYSINDGGNATFLITDTQPSTAYITLTNGNYAKYINNGKLYVEMFGAKGDNTNDDTTAIQTALNFAIATKREIYFSSKTYKITSSITINDSTTPLLIEGNNATLSLNASASYSALNLTCKNIEINNLHIDGINTSQDQFSESTYSNLIILTGFNLNASTIKIDGSNLTNFYGNGIKFLNYSMISLNNIKLNNVGGHWYQNNEYDAFGDAFYFGGHSGNAQIQINNCDCIGKYKNSTLSRIGIAIENLTELVDGKTNININNSNFLNYDRCIHTESTQGTIYVNWNHGNTYNNVFAFSLTDSTDKLYLNVNDLNITYTTSSYNGTYGIKGTNFVISNSIINATVHSIANYINTGSYNNCIFNNIGSTQVNSLSTNRIDINNCTLNIAGTYASNTFLYSSTNVHITNCIFNASSTIAQLESGSKYFAKSCTYNNVLPYAIYEDLNNKIYTTNYTLSITRYGNIMPCYYYNDGTLIYEPSIAKTFKLYSIDDAYNYEKRNIPADGTISLYPTVISNLHLKNHKCVLITIATENQDHLFSGRNFQNFYYNILTIDYNGTVTAGVTQQIGTASTGGYGLTIDDTNKTIARNGTYSRIACQWIVPLDEFNSLNSVS